MRLPETDCPPVLRRTDPPQVATLAQLLSAVVQTLAAKHGVEPSLLATTADLQELVRRRLGMSASAPDLLDGWRGEILRPLQEVLEGARAVRVADVRSKHPLALVENPESRKG
jgi:ribonuclease D